MRLDKFVQLMREEFAIFAEPVVGKPYAVRFVGSPYNTFLPDCPSLIVFAHNRGTTVSPLVIAQVLKKSGSNETDFRSAYNSFFSQRPLLGTLPAMGLPAKPLKPS